MHTFSLPPSCPKTINVFEELVLQNKLPSVEKPFFFKTEEYLGLKGPYSDPWISDRDARDVYQQLQLKKSLFKGKHENHHKVLAIDDVRARFPRLAPAFYP